MKKALLLIAAFVTIGTFANAQNALGVRLGGGQGYGAELSWQTGLGGNRLELDLGLRTGDHFTAFNLYGIYQWTGTISGNFGWFAGVGAALGYRNWEHDFDGDGNIDIAAVGQAGLEYNFQAVPIQLSLDIRPKFFILPETEFHWGDIALGIRFRF
ncbi:MAG: hypothetical protein J6T56_02615 [Bacteroidales bacterium]|nr:hypothetical protein [Bacteroidales bacterium]MBP5614023.1 hypothetical protein [Bacteroidales bacterium]